MPLIAKNKGGKNFEPVPEDQHIGRCVLIVDIGTQESSYGDKHQCIIGWELPQVLQVFDETKGEEPSMLSKFFTISLNEKANLRLALESWRGKAFSDAELEGFDLEALAAAPCLLQVIHKTAQNGDVRAQINAVSKLPKGLECPPQVTPTRVFTLDGGTQQDFEGLPEWVQDQIKSSAEYGAWCQRNPGGEQVFKNEPITEVTFGSDAPPQDEVPF